MGCLHTFHTDDGLLPFPNFSGALHFTPQEDIKCMLNRVPMHMAIPAHWALCQGPGKTWVSMDEWETDIASLLLLLLAYTRTDQVVLLHIYSSVTLAQALPSLLLC